MTYCNVIITKACSVLASEDVHKVSSGYLEHPCSFFLKPSSCVTHPRPYPLPEPPQALSLATVHLGLSSVLFIVRIYHLLKTSLQCCWCCTENSSAHFCLTLNVLAAEGGQDTSLIPRFGICHVLMLYVCVSSRAKYLKFQCYSSWNGPLPVVLWVSGQH